ncbi:DNA processing protein [Nocardia sp. GAS34]|uniref:DNA-processing protein DprA n=1 Tax=unclassified Nocardia TaxID=2637762 RepID=UPI003D19AAB1
MTTDTTLRALVAFQQFRTPAKVTRALLDPNPASLRQVWREMDRSTRMELGRQSDALTERGVVAISADDQRFPRSLVINGRPIAPVLFCLGPIELLTTPGVGICGSRKATPFGLNTARVCGHEISAHAMTTISGYAKGVDTESHLGALERSGSTVLVLAEGIDHFRIKRDVSQQFAPDRVLAVSQFHPRQPWAAHAAMTRNHLIFNLGMALVVIEAGERGGTLAAGQEALKRGQHVLVLDLGEHPSPGNKILLHEGAQAVSSREALRDALSAIKNQRANRPEQGELL